MWRALPAIGFGIVLALALDQAIRLLLPPAGSENRHWYLQTVQYHPVLGWSGYPNFAGTKDGNLIQTNSLGYRDREPSATTGGGKLEVLFVGDSFTWGDEVKQEERFSDLLEASCGSLCDRLQPVRSTNHGVIGYGTAQSLLDYMLDRGERPYEAVILALYTGNDLTDNTTVDSPSGPRPRLIRCDQEKAYQGLCLEGVPVPAVVDWPEHRLINDRGGVARALGWSGLISMARDRRAPGFLIDRRIAAQMANLSGALPFPIVTRTSDAPLPDRIGQLESILRAFNRTVRDGGKSFGVMVFPSARVYSGDPEGELREYARILDVLNRLDIPVVDFYAETKGFRLEDLYSGDQGHWRASGHQEAAKLLRPLLVRLKSG